MSIVELLLAMSETGDDISRDAMSIYVVFYLDECCNLLEMPNNQLVFDLFSQHVGKIKG